jgi:hypothetical protein
MIFCECGNVCAHCLEDECCLCRLKEGKEIEACPDCRKVVLEYMMKYSKQMGLERYLVMS